MEVLNWTQQIIIYSILQGVIDLRYHFSRDMNLFIFSHNILNCLYNIILYIYKLSACRTVVNSHTKPNLHNVVFVFTKCTTSRKDLYKTIHLFKFIHLYYQRNGTVYVCFFFFYLISTQRRFIILYKYTHTHL